MRTVLCVLAVPLMLAGCRSGAVRLYTLSEPHPIASSDARTVHADPFVLEFVRIPASIDRKELVVRKSAGELVLIENANWAAPLRDEVNAALVAGLRTALSDAKPREPAALATTVAVRVDIRTWEASPRGVYLEAEWRIREPNAAARPPIRCDREFMQRSSGTAEDLVRADQALLAALAQAIAATLLTRPPEHCWPQ
jgi:uncharacterized lipoprotein YmbA